MDDCLAKPEVGLSWFRGGRSRFGDETNDGTGSQATVPGSIQQESVSGPTTAEWMRVVAWQSLDDSQCCGAVSVDLHPARIPLDVPGKGSGRQRVTTAQPQNSEGCSCRDVLFAFWRVKKNPRAIPHDGRMAESQRVAVLCRLLRCVDDEPGRLLEGSSFSAVCRDAADCADSVVDEACEPDPAATTVDDPISTTSPSSPK
ncbi:hypothetical protein PG997_001834 [Apiospora hydei]|uniref:Uncharacterized protein n=1 Tax=Apiospora hydei TaxID=1337664 RepID=A0ABR1X7X2_9PEZI